jgi:simple sugar transport system substrate-binding protein
MRERRVHHVSSVLDREEIMKKALSRAVLSAACVAGVSGAFAQSGGALSTAVGGYTFEEAAKPAPETNNFNNADGKLTFAIVTHTAGNGFFDPTYVGAKVAADMIGANLIMLGSEAPVDDIPREIEILNQVANDPTIDGLILTTPQSGAYDDIVKKLMDKGIPVATTNSFDPESQPQRHQPHRPELRRGGHRRRSAGQVPDRQGRRERLDHLPVHHHPRQRRGEPAASPPPSRPP